MKHIPHAKSLTSYFIMKGGTLRRASFHSLVSSLSPQKHPSVLEKEGHKRGGSEASEVHFRSQDDSRRVFRNSPQPCFQGCMPELAMFL